MSELKVGSVGQWWDGGFTWRGVGVGDTGGELSLGTGKEEGTSIPRHSFHVPSVVINGMITKRFRTARRSTQKTWSDGGLGEN